MTRAAAQRVRWSRPSKRVWAALVAGLPCAIERFYDDAGYVARIEHPQWVCFTRATEHHKRLVDAKAACVAMARALAKGRG